MKYEPKEKSSSAARLGKATGSYVDDLVKFYGIKNWKRKWQDYPQNKSEFTEKEQNKYVGMIRELKADGVDIGDLTPEEAVINIRETNQSFGIYDKKPTKSEQSNKKGYCSRVRKSFV